MPTCSCTTHQSASSSCFLSFLPFFGAIDRVKVEARLILIPTASMTDPKHDPPNVEFERAAAPLSKNAQKRLIKAARRAAQKSERRARERAHRKERKRLSRPKVESDLQTPSAPAIPFDVRVIVDLGFDELMTTKVSTRLYHP